MCSVWIKSRKISFYGINQSTKVGFVQNLVDKIQWVFIWYLFALHKPLHWIFKYQGGLLLPPILNTQYRPQFDISYNVLKVSVNLRFSKGIFVFYIKICSGYVLMYFPHKLQPRWIKQWKGEKTGTTFWCCEFWMILDILSHEILFSYERKSRIIRVWSVSLSVSQ